MFYKIYLNVPLHSVPILVIFGAEQMGTASSRNSTVLGCEFKGVRKNPRFEGGIPYFINNFNTF